MILDQIVEARRKQLKEEMSLINIEGWKVKLKRPGLHNIINFEKALKKDNEIAIIGEVKKASPSKGIIRDSFNPVEIANEYKNAGIDAMSVLTEKNFFQGCDEFLVSIRQSNTAPIIRKDFIIDVWQIYQARYIGADAILLIAAILTTEEIKKFLAVAGILGLKCLVEVHNEEELERVLETDASIIGINNRNLQTFQVSLDTTEKLISRIPENKIVVSESGIENYEDMKRLKKIGVNAVLIGESFMRATSISDKMKELRTGEVR
jgi:indole-3-glycerol phosphate synthase